MSEIRLNNLSPRAPQPPAPAPKPQAPETAAALHAAEKLIEQYQAGPRGQMPTDEQLADLPPLPADAAEALKRALSEEGDLELLQKLSELPPEALEGLRDRLDFGRVDADGDGHIDSDEVEDQAEFRAMDHDDDGKVTREEHAAYRKAQAAPTADGQPAEPQSTYTTAYAHPVDELASQLGFGSADEMLEANPGLRDVPTYPQIPAGTPVNAPMSNGAVQGRMQALDTENGGGHYAPPTTAGPAGAQPNAASPKTGGPAVTGAPGDPNSYFMTQFTHEKWNPNGPNASANCGPTSLAMALKAFGIQPPGLTDPNDPEAWIDATRQAMGAMTDSYGHYGDHAYTDVSQIVAGAQASGATAEPVGFEGVDQALAEGKLVVASGDPVAYNGDWQERGISNSEYDGGHFILITGKDANGNYLINDPLSNVGSVAVTPAQLQAYMAYQGWNQGVAIGRP